MKNNEFTLRADGRLQTSIVDPKTGKRKYFYGKTKRELRQKILEYNSNEKTGPLFNEVSAAWWDEAEEQLAYQSRRSYKISKEQADIEFENIYIKEIQPQNITSYYRKLSQRGMAQKTVEKRRLVLNLIFKYAMEQGYIQYNPCSVSKIPKGLKKSKREAASEKDEKIIKERTDLWLFPFVSIYTGMRKGEILALQWKDVDFENECITVTKSIYFKGNAPNVKEPKTEAGIRVIPLLRPLKEQLLKLPHQDPNRYLFSDDGKTPLTEKRYARFFKEYQQATGITCTAHNIRHSFATIAFEHDVPVKTVQEILGHKQISTTMDLYTHFRKSHIKKVTADLNNIFDR